MLAAGNWLLAFLLYNIFQIPHIQYHYFKPGGFVSRNFNDFLIIIHLSLIVSSMQYVH